MSVTATGGTVGRAATLGAVGAWLLEIDMGAQIVRVATEPLSITSTELGGEVAFQGGLSDFSSQLVVDSLPVTVTAQAGQSWCDFRRRLGPIRGRRVRLWRWYEGQVLEDSYLLLEGILERVTYGDPRNPDDLRATLTRNNRALSRSYPSSRMIVGTDTWPLPADRYLGEVYPVVIGAPGSRETISGGGVPNSVTPGLIVNFQTLDKRVLIAGHHVAAQQVRVSRRSEAGDEAATIAVVNEYDSLGRAVATVQTVGSTFATGVLANDEFVIGWDRSADWGVGLMHRGRSVEGLGDLLIWGAETLTTSRWDLAAMEGQRLAMNRFRLDTFWNDSIPWEDWVQRNVLSAFPVEEVSGPSGRYYRPIVYETNARKIRARLATVGSGSGRRVERVAPVSEGADDIVNSVELSYAASDVGNAMRKRLSLGPKAGEVPLYEGLAADQAGADFRAAASAAYYGERSVVLEVPQVWDEATASQIAQAIIGTSALPGRATQYLGGPELLDLSEHDTVELYDTTAGACFEGDLAIVDRITIEPSAVRLDVWAPDDPLRRPTSSSGGL